MDISADKTHFLSIPWCAALLTVPNTIIEPMESRRHKPSTEDAFFSETLSTKDTISSCVVFYVPPASSSPIQRIHKLNLLMTLGYAVNGYPKIAHGGLVATILDESMGLLLHENKMRGVLEGVGNTVTAYLNVSYKKAVPTPATVLIEVELKEVKGRKYFVEANVKDENGEVLAKAEALFIGVRKSEEKL